MGMSQNEVPFFPQIYLKFKGTFLSKRAPLFEAYPYGVPKLYPDHPILPHV